MPTPTTPPAAEPIQPPPAPTPAAVPAPAPTPPPIAQAAPPIAPVPPAPIDVEAATRAAIAGEQTRILEITALCEQAKCPDLARQFVKAGLSAGEVQTKLWDVLVKNNPPLPADGGGDAALDPADPDAKYKAEFQARAAQHGNSGVTLERYIRSRQIDDGKLTLKTGALVKK